MAQSSEWLDRIPESVLDEVDVALAHFKALGLEREQMQRGHFPVPSFEASLPALAAELESGRGFVQIKGLRVDTYSPSDAEIVYGDLVFTSAQPSRRIRVAICSDMCGTKALTSPKATCADTRPTPARASIPISVAML